jgi:hypothetical protein
MTSVCSRIASLSAATTSLTLCSAYSSDATTNRRCILGAYDMTASGISLRMTSYSLFRRIKVASSSVRCKAGLVLREDADLIWRRPSSSSTSSIGLLVRMTVYMFNRLATGCFRCLSPPASTLKFHGIAYLSAYALKWITRCIFGRESARSQYFPSLVRLSAFSIFQIGSSRPETRLGYRHCVSGDCCWCWQA